VKKNNENLSGKIVPASSVGLAFRRAVKSFALLKESRIGMAGLFLVLLWILIAIFAPLIAPYDPLANFQPFLKPGMVDSKGNLFLLGTDQIGRDILSRLIFGARRVLIFAPLATFSAYLVGIVMGLLAGYRGGWWDIVLTRVGDVILSFPPIVLYIVIIGVVGATAINIVAAIILASGPGIMRIVRGLVLDIRTREYIAAAETRGESDLFIMLVEILPNARGPLIVDACLRLGFVTITIGILAFLGLGLPPPEPDWGGMVNEARVFALAFPHMTLFPCIAISSLVLGFNLLADGLREISLRD